MTYGINRATVAELAQSQPFSPTLTTLRSPCAMLVGRHTAARTGAVHSDLAKRGRRVMRRRLKRGRAGSDLREVANPRTIPSGGLSRRTASALHGPGRDLSSGRGPQSPSSRSC